MIRKSYAKVNIFLKITGLRGEYHELASRFVRVHSLYDLIKFQKKDSTIFTLKGNFSCSIKKNTIYKAYELLKEISSKVEKYFKEYIVVVEKNIPEFAGLGGGSSNAATFMLMVNEACELNLSKEQLCKIATQVGADVPFFIYEYDSANVTGIGEIVEKFEEEILNIKVITPQIKCDTGEIFRKYRKDFYKNNSEKNHFKLLGQKSKKILENSSIFVANDLYAPAKSIYKELSKYEKKQWFFSGSGSSFFKVY